MVALLAMALGVAGGLVNADATFTNLGMLANDDTRSYAIAHGVNTAGGDNRATRWTVSGSTAIESLGILPGGFSSMAYGVSGDGSSVVGTSTASGGLDRAFLWTPSLGMVDLNAYLPTLGVDVKGWELERATGISADGTAITGVGTLQNVGTRSFVVQVVPEPSTSAIALTGLACGGSALMRRRRRR